MGIEHTLGDDGGGGAADFIILAILSRDGVWGV
jgi:hypothetical protein